ncbi:hypothetical protein CTDIVETGP_2932 [Clostridium tyrobutyricum DIVETGP]|uniref:Uncharacterized protein n=1 Tax=Clostridium tyrobutyricum DIVETGP TaxID=1408889 RepID=W6NM22_CLOTY|nr:hypothetical protein [Clostridium tyrobutyricum]CDL92862.1 hypothetical protein CTDIVETGP_2932 [Clostridium tyrobutyricum DIVETGP]AND85754.1 hypothetical protein CTK_C25080 [Clostridium tyrobutyricum]MBR9648319.1 hypothetical protein [Clostridium tyrobutyricum]MBV4424480.1 hypothetical protein [Clostridium tyrobutyricum]MBV4434703.1 hypothetical protein [Clostridium tyrobutyricum]
MSFVAIVNLGGNTATRPMVMGGVFLLGVSSSSYFIGGGKRNDKNIFKRWKNN